MADSEYLVAPTFTTRTRPPLQKVRGSLLASSMRAVRDAGRESDYFSALPSELEMEIRSIVTSEWYPIELAMQHYGAMDSLGFSADQAEKNGAFVLDRLEKSYISTVVRGLGKQVGPIPLLKRVPVVWARILEGGDIAVRTKGPKDVEIEMLGLCLAEYRYVRHGWLGIFSGAIGVVTRRCFGKVLPAADFEKKTVIALSWV